MSNSGCTGFKGGYTLGDGMEQIGDCTLYCADALDILPTLGPVHAVVTDPPYGLAGGASHGECQKPDARWRYRPLRQRGSSLPQKVNEQVDNRWIPLVMSQTQWAIIWGGNHFPLPAQAGWLVWDKGTAGDASDCELAWTNLVRDSIRRFYYLWSGFRKAHPEERWHPTQKPVAVMMWCLDQLPSGVRTVLDPFAGSGTVGVACLARGKRAILIERDPQYFDSACQRIEEAYCQLSLFPSMAPRPSSQQEALF